MDKLLTQRIPATIAHKFIEKWACYFGYPFYVVLFGDLTKISADGGMKLASLKLAVLRAVAQWDKIMKWAVAQ